MMDQRDDERRDALGDSSPDLHEVSGPQKKAKAGVRWVSPNDPRYLDTRYFPIPEEGENAIKARLRQVEAAKAHQERVRLEHGSMAISDKGRVRGVQGAIQRYIGQLGKRSLKEAFPDLVPKRMRCTDDYQYGLLIRRRERALRHRLIEFNGSNSNLWMLHDNDRVDAEHSYAAAGVAEPNIIMINPANGHAHSAYLLSNPVARHPAARSHPLRYFAAIEQGIARRIGTDPAYTRLLAKNPLHPHWEVQWRRNDPYSLAELANGLSPEDMRLHVDRVSGAGRNVTLFDTLRKIAYGEVVDFKNAGNSVVEYGQHLQAVALQINQQFPVPLPHSELRSTLRSVVSWTWRKFSSSEFSALQSVRGKRGAIRRWEGHAAASTAKPWDAEGISERTYYRHKKLEALLSGTPAPSAKEPWKPLGISRATYFRRKRDGKL